MTQVPPKVNTAVALWCAAIGAGVAETGLFVTQAALAGEAGGLAAQAALRLAVYGLLAFAAWRLRTGAGWLRIAVAVLVGGFGTLSMVAGPVGWLLDGGSVPAFLAAADPWTLGFTGLRTAHVLLVVAALVVTFSPASNRFFAGSRPAEAERGALRHG
ncbi:hypothetical protein LX16_2805 [Stackebrandtia albiflava]|uniref:Uncharacterized protein n=1 Tax=Stackebrandtia albiflava TaxID=406432 RepID=A0A562V2G2_9ACTN|nr:hypothetical protein [Stackebrandtia albiflava]TWJ12058.1 hypothetical protein LX16_2805 [Stackebrandtia albiflava]